MSGGAGSGGGSNGGVCECMYGGRRRRLNARFLRWDGQAWVEGRADMAGDASECACVKEPRRGELTGQQAALFVGRFLCCFVASSLLDSNNSAPIAAALWGCGSFYGTSPQPAPHPTDDTRRECTHARTHARNTTGRQIRRTPLGGYAHENKYAYTHAHRQPKPTTQPSLPPGAAAIHACPFPPPHPFSNLWHISGLLGLAWLGFSVLA